MSVNSTINLALIKPGISFREFAELSWRIPDEFRR